MTLQTSGIISLSDIAEFFGNPDAPLISLSNYYAGGNLVPAGTIGYPNGVATPIPTSGKIGLSNFYGAYTPPALHDYSLPGTYSFELPSGVRYISASLRGGKGGSGAGDVYNGGLGFEGRCLQVTVDTTLVGLGDITRSRLVTIYVGSKGNNGSALGGAGGTGYHAGGNGGKSGYAGSSGGGGGGGGSSAMFIDGVLIAEAGGGGGGAGAGQRGPGNYGAYAEGSWNAPNAVTIPITQAAPPNGFANMADGGGAGGGGGGGGYAPVLYPGTLISTTRVNSIVKYVYTALAFPDNRLVCVASGPNSGCAETFVDLTYKAIYGVAGKGWYDVTSIGGGAGGVFYNPVACQITSSQRFLFDSNNSNSRVKIATNVRTITEQVLSELKVSLPIFKLLSYEIDADLNSPNPPPENSGG